MRWEGVKYFLEYTDIKEKAYNVFIHLNKDKPFVKGKLVDLDQLDAIYKETCRLWNLAHDYYYWYEENDIPMARVAEGLAKMTGKSKDSWNQYISRTLWFRIDTRSVLAIGYKDEQLKSFIKWGDENIRRLSNEKQG